MTSRVRRRGPAGWTLRTRLLAALLTLLAAVSVVVGLVSVLALDSFLTDRLDRQLAAAGTRLQDDDAGSVRDDAGPPGLAAAGQAEGTLGALVTGGAVTSAAVLDARGRPLTLTGTQ